MNEIIELLQLDSADDKYLNDITEKEYFGFPISPILEAEKKLRSPNDASIAYFSMEYGLALSVYHTFKTNNPIKKCNILSNHEVFSNMKDMDYYHYLPVKKILDLPIYSGGLGVLAGDTLKSAADLGIPLIGIGILWKKGYFQQKFWFRIGGQLPEETSWDPYSYPGLIPLKPKIDITLSGQKLFLKLWKYYVFSYDLSQVVPLILLDADLEENPEYFRELTYQLYRSSNNWIKIAQRMILGIGGIKALETLGYQPSKYHLNEGHAAFAFLEKVKKENFEELKKKFAYTCHTPVEAGHDRFDLKELEAALGKEMTEMLKTFGRDEKNPNLANLSILALNTCQHANAVSQKHGEVTRMMFPNFKEKILSITNGIHTFTWLSEPVKNLLLKYKKEIGDWEKDPTLLKNITSLKNNPNFRQDLWNAHLENKRFLAQFLEHWFFDERVFTLGWARRIAIYKRPTLLLQNPNRLVEIAKKHGPLQIVIAGKAHPDDVPASLHLDEMLEKITMLSGERKLLRICFLENYDTYFAKILTSSVDVWLNNPLPPYEASGTSGMKAILNGVVQLSTLDGWVVEAADKSIGKIFGQVPALLEKSFNPRLIEDSKALYQSLEELIPLYYQTFTGKTKIEESPWIDMMINCLIEANYFSTHRMVAEYNEKIWKVST